eukprot:10188322-Alexandrium_andersonii.AAC.1
MGELWGTAYSYNSPHCKDRPNSLENTAAMQRQSKLRCALVLTPPPSRPVSYTHLRAHETSAHL